MDVLAIGSIRRDDSGEVLEAHSTSVLIRTGSRAIVVDTSTKHMEPMLRTSFKQIGIFPDDVDTVVLTHSHDDHTGNLGMFRNAKVIMHRDEEKNIPGAKLIDSDTELFEGIRIVCTPGHTRGSVSVFIDSDLKYAVVGDAVPTYSNFEKMAPPAISYDRDVALQSIKSIAKYADVIIPGHDPPFFTRM